MEESRWAPKQTNTPSGLNPSAPSFFSPTSIPTSYPEDEFAAQTRAADDLFGDDFTPIAEVPQAPAHTPHFSRGRGDRGFRARGGGRGRGRGRGGYTAQVASETATAQTPSVEVAANEANTEATLAAPAELEQTDQPVPAEATTTEATTSLEAAATPAARRPSSQAVRGDRTATGGVTKPKLTEEELAARMEAVKLKNASLEAAHARAEADEASFREREVQAQERRRQEHASRQQMNSEREKNRMRKLKAMSGREWDEGKTEEEERDTRRSQYKRGAHGGVGGQSRDVRKEVDVGDVATETPASGWGEPTVDTASGWDDQPTKSWAEESAAIQAQFDNDNAGQNATSRWVEETSASAEFRSGRGGRDRGRGRGRGDRGSRGSRGDFGAGRGGRGRGGPAAVQQQRVPREEDFPTLGSPPPKQTTATWGKPSTPKAAVSAEEPKPAESQTAAPDWMNAPSNDAWADDDAPPVRSDVKW